MRDPAFLSEPFEDWVQDFLGSDAARGFREDVLEAGGLALPAFLKAACRRAGGALESVRADHAVRALRHDLHALGIPASARPQLPALVGGFLAYLETVGRLSGGEALGEAVRAGGGAGEDRAPAPDVGRNDPCPCGSGRKFKKCCGG